MGSEEEQTKRGGEEGMGKERKGEEGWEEREVGRGEKV